jgi:uracil-DNA glycosylase
MIKFTFERDIDDCFRKFKIPRDRSNDFVGQSYLIANKIHKNWFPLFRENSELLCKIFDQLERVKFYPKYNEIFNIFKTDPKDLKCICQGQDPYHSIEGQAHGYSFSVPRGTPIPPSLVNIFKELNNEYPGKYKFTHGNLEAWSSEVFLLNAALTVVPNTPGSHMNIWQPFTDKVIEYISYNYSGKVFLLLGNFATKKGIYIDVNRHTIVTAAHPSPLSCKLFFGSNVFIKVDQALAKYGKGPINWNN